LLRILALYIVYKAIFFILKLHFFNLFPHYT